MNVKQVVEASKKWGYMPYKNIEVANALNSLGITELPLAISEQIGSYGDYYCCIQLKNGDIIQFNHRASDATYRACGIITFFAENKTQGESSPKIYTCASPRWNTLKSANYWAASAYIRTKREKGIFEPFFNKENYSWD